MTPLERLLDGLRVEIEPFVVSEVRRKRPAGRRHVSPPTMHGTVSGWVVLELSDGATIHLSKERVIVVPARAAMQPVSRKEAEHDGDPQVSTACGRFRATYQGSIGLFDRLREPLMEDLDADDPIRRSLEELLTEVRTQRAGYRAMAETLLRHCLILLLRRCFEHRDCPRAWLAALEDSRLGRAVAAMQERPEEAFTLTGLAEVAGMSRSVFAVRFADALGRPPMEFLKMVRLTRAAQLLTHTDLPIKTVAARAGYSSRSSFTRAFFARYGVDPTAFRADGTRSGAYARRVDDTENASDAA